LLSARRHSDSRCEEGERRHYSRKSSVHLDLPRM
jgi:hypothetical protein